MKTLIGLCLLFISATATAAGSKLVGDFDFETTATAHYCYQDRKLAYEQALRELQLKASLACTTHSPYEVEPVSRAIRTTEIAETSGGCSVKLTAGFICERSRYVCRRYGYMRACCDRITKSCTIE